jgi:lipase maturation factor 1
MAESGQTSDRSSRYAVATWLFLRLVGLVYLFAFWSLAQQVQLLIGHDGILPAADYMSEARVWAEGTGVGWERYRLLPTVFWVGTSDELLKAVPIVGAILAGLQLAGFGSIVVLPILWLLYLSVNVVGRDFLSFQWDSLLLETGLIAIALTPLRWRHRLRDGIEPPAVARWMAWWLVFRLMFGSGFVKLASGDPTWHNLTAMLYHFETQPLPTPLAWFAAQAPRWWQEVTTALTLLIELAAPWLIVGGVRARRIAAVPLIGLQVAIALTGNYTFFNLLSIALCLTLVDDAVLGRLAGAVSVQRPRLAERALAIALAIVLLPASVVIFARQLGVGSDIPIVRTVVDMADPFRSVNTYGLFAVMTTTRPEIVLEGSVDGVNWKAYEFRYKPGSLTRRPRWVAPFQPRVDWQMWFAALGTFDSEVWFQQFCKKILEGSPAVATVFEDNPFPAMPPRFLRGELYQYRFAPRGSQAWWIRERSGDYSPVLSLKPR